MYKLLLVDHNQNDSERYKKYAQKKGFEMLSFQDGREAIQIFQKSPKDFVLAIVLWELAGEISGPELISQIHSHNPDLLIMVLNQNLSWEVASKAYAVGAGDCLLKPVDYTTFAGVLERAVRPGEPDTMIFKELCKILKGNSKVFLNTLRILAKIIPDNECPVLLTGESGTGKELMAKAIHDLGPHQNKKWVPINCAAIPSSLIESHFFGHESGSFTGANYRRIGCFEEAEDGTLFLDEIGDMNVELQSKILRAIEERVFRRVGGKEDIPFRARLVCATNKNLTQEIVNQKFRADLYYRINRYEVRVPPLRDREDDIIMLTKYFVEHLSGESDICLDRETIAVLNSYSFPGNIRELYTITERAIRQKTGKNIRPMDIPIELMSYVSEDIKWPANLIGMTYTDATKKIIRDFNRHYLPFCLESCKGKVLAAARKAGVDPKTFRNKWEECGLGHLSTQEKET